MGKMKQLENELLRMDLPHFDAGDTVKVNVKIREGEKERIQAFQGVVISKKKEASTHPLPSEKFLTVSVLNVFSPCIHRLSAT